MSKEMRLRDFQVSINTTGNMDDDVIIGRAFFTSFEPVVLWLRERIIKAPFGKLVVNLTNDATRARLEGHIMVAFGICHVAIAVDFSTLLQNAADHRWVFGRVLHALIYVDQQLGWRSPELEAFLVATCEKERPLVHFFDRFTRTFKKVGVTCIPWFSTQPGETKLGVRLITKDGAERDVTLLSKAESLYMEDDFPLAKLVIHGSTLVFLDKAGNILAAVPIVEPGLV
jgi:hypothetical protein